MDMRQLANFWSPWWLQMANNIPDLNGLADCESLLGFSAATSCGLTTCMELFCESVLPTSIGSDR